MLPLDLLGLTMKVATTKNAPEEEDVVSSVVVRSTRAGYKWRQQRSEMKRSVKCK
jgi:hypothetical protein